ncbi:MAG: lipid asymmetry maintenance protein MlaB [Pseudomonadota bacterium]
MSTSVPELVRAQDGTITVTGQLDVTSVAACKESGEELIEDADEVVFDLAGTEVKGSAVIALLIAWQRQAEKLAKPVRFVNAPPNLLEIAEVCGVRDIIPFE